MILITGADGYLGLRLTQRVLDQTDQGVLAWVRARHSDEVRQKSERLERSLNNHQGRLRVCSGQLTDAEPFRDLGEANQITKIIHTAAVIRFNVDQDTAVKVNVEGAKKIYDFATTACPQLERFVYVSSLYASGLESGLMPEGPFRGSAGFANHYERSKFDAEALLQSQYQSLPWQIHRVATIVCDDSSGHVTQFNAVHNTLKLLYYGLLSLVPGARQTPVHLVTGDYVTNAILKASEQGVDHQFYNVCHSAAECLTLERLIDTVFESFLRFSEDFKARRLLKPLFVDHSAFETMSKAVQGFGSEITNQALASMTPFAEELFVQKDVDNQNVRRLLGGDYPQLPASTLIERVCQYLAKTKFGRELTS